MANLRLGNTLVIANPMAHSGRGAAAADQVRRFFLSYASVTGTFTELLTNGPGDGMRMASQAQVYDTVVALGGDGVIHEVANGLMSIDEKHRPTLAVVPMGSGNDFARTLGMNYNNPDVSLAEILSGTRTRIDLGSVTSDTDGRSYFVETLSFGLDAAIALDTTKRREKDSPQSGAGLFATSSLKLASRVRGASSARPCTVTIDGGEPLSLQTVVLALQNGPTYGGGFRICPDAVPNDGRLGLCYNVGVPSVPKLLALFARARVGRHVGSPYVRTGDFAKLQVEFTQGEPPCQVDGEPLHGTRFEVEAVPKALEVVVPPACPWLKAGEGSRD